MLSRPKVDAPFAEPVAGQALASDARTRQVCLWSKPVLSVYGDVRELTMGGSPGTGDSGGSGLVQRFP